MEILTLELDLPYQEWDLKNQDRGLEANEKNAVEEFSPCRIPKFIDIKFAEKTDFIFDIYRGIVMLWEAS